MIGKTLAHYQIESLLGVGGMGEVYRARDLKLGRVAAVKLLPDEFASDAERVARFEREAKVLAALNHPNIAALYGMEHADGKHFLVMELVEGETLAERIRRAPVPVEEALRIMYQIAEALEAAHEKGIVHRDLKPANVKITPDEKVKVLDFGLAKATEAAPVSTTLSNSPTISMAATQAGVILGTAAYMSPEQAKAMNADARSDVFSFGCVFFELLTGRQTFQGETASEILAAVLIQNPDLTTLPPNLNPRIQDLLQRCLEKTPKRRWQAIGDLRAEIEAIAKEPRVVPMTATAVKPGFPLWKMAIVLLIAVGVTAAVTRYFVSRTMEPTTPAVIRFPFELPGQQFFGAGPSTRQAVALSPDGAHLVYVAVGGSATESGAQLYLRSISEMTSKPVPGTDLRVVNPFFSPDGQWIGFFSTQDSTFKKVAVTGGAPVTLCKADSPWGASWYDDVIVFGQGNKGIMRVSANGGEAEVIARMEPNERAYGPQLIDGGRQLLFTLAGFEGPETWDRAQIVVQSMSSGVRKAVMRGGSDGRYVPTGHLVYSLGGNILAVPFDERKAEVVGGPVPIIEGVMRSTTVTGVSQFTFSSNGVLAYVPAPYAGSTARRTLALVDATGKVQPLALPPQPYLHPRISPDGKQVAYAMQEGQQANIWIYSLNGSAPPRRLTFSGQTVYPIWTPDGRRVTFTDAAPQERSASIYWQLADGSGSAERLTMAAEGEGHAPLSWSPDGKVLLFSSDGEKQSRGIWTLSLDGEKKTEALTLVPAAFSAGHATFSPNGRWLAYSSTEAGAPRIFVQPYPLTGAKYQVTTDAGINPVWSQDGKQIFYDNRSELMSVEVQTTPNFTIGKTSRIAVQNLYLPSAGIRDHDITPDGKQRLVIVLGGGSEDGTVKRIRQVNFVLNWFTELQQRVPVN